MAPKVARFGSDMVQGERSRVDHSSQGASEETVFLGTHGEQDQPIDLIRAAVDITKEAARAISITALEAVREGALFMGVILSLIHI